MSYMRRFVSGESLVWLDMHKPHKTTVRFADGQPGEFIVEGPADMHRRVDEFVSRFESEPLHLMHSFGRKCDHCGRMTWPGMPGAAERVTDDPIVWATALDNCRARPTPSENTK